MIVKLFYTRVYLFLCTVITFFLIPFIIYQGGQGSISETLVPLFIILNQTWKLMSVTVFMGYQVFREQHWRRDGDRGLSGSDSMLASSCSQWHCQEGQQELFSSGLSGMVPSWKSSERISITQVCTESFFFPKNI